MLPTDPNKKKKLIIYYYKFKTSNLVINNSPSTSIGVLQKTNVIYQLKCPLEDFISENNNVYVCLTSTTLSRRLITHLSYTSSIAQHRKKHSCPTTEFREILMLPWFKTTSDIQNDIDRLSYIYPTCYKYFKNCARKSDGNITSLSPKRDWNNQIFFDQSSSTRFLVNVKVIYSIYSQN